MCLFMYGNAKYINILARILFLEFKTKPQF